AAFRVCEQLRPHLATLMGKGGFHALVMRALVMAQTEVAWLRTVQVNPDGSLRLEGLAAEVDPKEEAEGGVILVAQLLGLLVAFIGKDLTLGMVREVWPKLSLNDLDFSKGDKQ
ncbi:MAG: hypothetical protein U0984_01585, partial [Prosthecobacter sp.]|nr:hypothetical protein [Prosthecobacter sp.]